MTVSIQIASDLHVDWCENYCWCRNKLMPVADTLIVAGDTAPYNYKKRADFIGKVLLPRWKTIIEVPGNHDHYGMPADWEFASSIDENKFFMFNDVGKVTFGRNGNNYHYLHNKVYDLTPGVRIICSTLWSNVITQQLAVLKYMTDYHKKDGIKGYDIEINNARHAECVKFLDKSLSETPSGVKCVVVTHHLPMKSLIDDEFDVLEAYATDLYSLLYKHSEKISVWVSGHNHRFFDKTLGNIRFVRNPLGYPPPVGDEFYGKPRLMKSFVIEV